MYLNKENLKGAIVEAGLKTGDTVLVHSDLTAFGLIENFSKKELLNIFYESFIEILGNEGTLCVPAYFYDYARKSIPFDIELSPVAKELGVFPIFLNKIEGRKRSPNPLTSIIAIGKNADYICEHVNRHSYGEDSAYDRLYKLNAKILFLGKVSIKALTFTHYIEYRVGVPYCYNKFYDIPVYSNNHVIFENTSAFVRYLDHNITYSKNTLDTIYNFFCDIMEQGMMVESILNNNSIFMSTAENLFNIYKEFLYKDPYSLLDTVPIFPKGVYPNK